LKNSGSERKKLKHLSAREFLAIPANEAMLLDVRPPYALSRLFDIDNIMYCPYTEIAHKVDALPKDVWLVIADAVGLRSKEVAIKLMDKEFTNIFHLAGGIVDWERGGHPVSTDNSRILTGSCMCQLKVRNKK
jgi:rhodanese-related sulfurtransferase